MNCFFETYLLNFKYIFLRMRRYATCNNQCCMLFVMKKPKNRLFYFFLRGKIVIDKVTFSTTLYYHEEKDQ